MLLAYEPEPIRRVTPGVPIYTSDGKRVGIVKEMRAHSFKVGTPLLKRDYWLLAETIASATPGVAVVLTMESNSLDEYKLREPAEAA